MSKYTVRPKSIYTLIDGGIKLGLIIGAWYLLYKTIKSEQ